MHCNSNNGKLITTNAHKKREEEAHAQKNKQTHTMIKKKKKKHRKDKLTTYTNKGKTSMDSYSVFGRRD